MAMGALLRSLRRRDVASSAPLAAYRCLTRNAKPLWAPSEFSQSWVNLSRPSSSIGGDLGAMESCVAEGKDPKAIKNSEGAKTAPPVFAFNPLGELLVGTPVKRQAMINPTNVLFGARHMFSTKPDDLHAHKGADEVIPKVLRPLSPHLPVYKPQVSSTSSIFNRISGAFLSAVILAFYLLCMKMGLICFTFESFYQLFFYSSKLTLLTVELSALALAYHVYHSIGHIVR